MIANPLRSTARNWRKHIGKRKVVNMNFEVLNQIIEKASQTSLDVVSAEITKSHNLTMALVMLTVISMTAVLASLMQK